MVYDEVPHVLHMVLIAGRELQDRLVTMITENGGHVTNIFYGKGAVKSSYIMSMFGLVHEKNKVLINCLISESEVDDIFNILAADFHFEKPHTGIAYTIPVVGLSY